MSTLSGNGSRHPPTHIYTDEKNSKNKNVLCVLVEVFTEEGHPIYLDGGRGEGVTEIILRAGDSSPVT